MGERRIYEFQYVDFMAILRRATKSMKKVEKSNKDAWSTYVRKHKVPEGAMMSRGKTGTMFGKLEAVIIQDMGESDGYYVYAPDEEFCLKFEPGDT